MKTTALVVILSMAVLSTAALAGEFANQETRTDASRLSMAYGPGLREPKAKVPGLMNYQGTLTDGDGVALDTTVAMTFSIYTDSVGGSQVWTETQLAVAVGSGMFDVLLGSLNEMPDSVFNDPERWLGVQVGGDPELIPRRRIAAVGYAFRAAEADTAEYVRSGGAGDDGDWTISGSNMYSAVSGNVGIGTSTPSYRLHVVGSSSSPILNIEQNGGGRAVRVSSTNACALWVANSGNHGLRVSNAAGNGVHVENAGYFAGYFDGSGYFSGALGIGTMSPAEKLHVVGNVQVDSTLQVMGFQLPAGASESYVLTSDASGVGSWQPVAEIPDSIMYADSSGYAAIAGTAPMPDSVMYADSSAYAKVAGYAPMPDSVMYADSSAYAKVAGYAPMPDSVAYADSAGADSDWIILGSDMYAAVSGQVGIGTSTPVAKLDVRGTLNVGTDGTGYDVNFYGADTGNRLFWDQTKAALRAGRDEDGTHWQPDTVGAYSIATGFNTTASGSSSTAMGHRVTARGNLGATAMGYLTNACGDVGATALGAGSYASGDDGATALGFYSTASGASSIAIGKYVKAGSADETIVLGKGLGHDARLINNIPGSLMVGFDSLTPTLFVNSSSVGIGTTSPTAELQVVGDIYCTGKLTSDGGNDPPYVLYSKETRGAIIERVSQEVPEDKLNGAVLFWNGDELRFEVYLPTRGEFRDLQGNLLAEISTL